MYEVVFYEEIKMEIVKLVIISRKFRKVNKSKIKQFI